MEKNTPGKLKKIIPYLSIFFVIAALLYSILIFLHIKFAHSAMQSFQNTLARKNITLHYDFIRIEKWFNPIHVKINDIRIYGGDEQVMLQAKLNDLSVFGNLFENNFTISFPNKIQFIIKPAEVLGTSTTIKRIDLNYEFAGEALLHFAQKLRDIDIKSFKFNVDSSELRTIFNPKKVNITMPVMRTGGLHFIVEQSPANSEGQSWVSELRDSEISFFPEGINPVFLEGLKLNHQETIHNLIAKVQQTCDEKCQSVVKDYQQKLAKIRVAGRIVGMSDSSIRLYGATIEHDIFSARAFGKYSTSSLDIDFVIGNGLNCLKFLQTIGNLVAKAIYNSSTAAHSIIQDKEVNALHQVLEKIAKEYQFQYKPTAHPNLSDLLEINIKILPDSEPTISGKTTEELLLLCDQVLKKK